MSSSFRSSLGPPAKRLRSGSSSSVKYDTNRDDYSEEEETESNGQSLEPQAKAGRVKREHSLRYASEPCYGVVLILAILLFHVLHPIPLNFEIRPLAVTCTHCRSRKISKYACSVSIATGVLIRHF